MGACLCVVGFRQPDEHWQKMKIAWDACKAAGIEPPEPLQRFFGWEEPDDAGIEVPFAPLIDQAPKDVVTEWRCPYGEGIEIDLDKLREQCPQLTKLHAYISW